MANGLFGDLGLPEQDAQALLALRQQEQDQAFRANTAQQQKAFSPAMQQAFQGGAFSGNLMGKALGAGQPELSPEEQQGQQSKQAVAQGLGDLQQSPEFSTMGPAEQQEAQLAAMSSALMGVGDNTRAAQTLQKLAEMRARRKQREEEEARKAREEGRSDARLALDDRTATTGEAREGRLARTSATDAERAGREEERSDARLDFERRRVELAERETRTFVDEAVETLETVEEARAEGETELADILMGNLRKKAGIRLDGGANLTKSERMINELYPPGDPRREQALLDQLQPRQRMTDFERRRAGWIESFGDELGNKIAVGAAEIRNDPITGRIAVTDFSTGDTTVIRDIDLGPGELPEFAKSIDIAPGESLYELSDFATGPGAYLSSGIEYAAALFDADVDTRYAAAAQTFNTRSQLAVKALSNNPRFPVGELELIRKDLTVTPGFFKDPQIARAQMNSLDRDLRTFLTAEIQTAQNTGLPESTRKEALQSAQNISTFLSTLLPQVPPDILQEAGLPRGSVYTGELQAGTDKPYIRMPNGTEGVIE